jgi:hypothetical protein
VRERTRAHGVSVKREKVTLADWPMHLVRGPRPTSSPALAQPGSLETLVCDSAEHTGTMEQILSRRYTVARLYGCV